MLHAADVSPVHRAEIIGLGIGEQVAEEQVGTAGDGIQIALGVGQATLAVISRLLGGDLDMGHHEPQDGNLLEVC